MEELQEHQQVIQASLRALQHLLAKVPLKGGSKIRILMPNLVGEKPEFTRHH